MSNIVPIQSQPLATTGASGTLKVQSMDDLARLAKMLCESGYFTDAKTASQTGVKVLAGLELGFPAFVSMTGIYIIQGKPAIGANLMAAAIKRSGKYNYRVKEHSETVCKIEFFEGKESIGMSEFSIEDAKKAGTQNISKYPKNMLFARAISNGVKWHCPDLFLGAPVYTPDELGVETNGDGEVINAQVVESSPQIESAEDRINKEIDERIKELGWKAADTKQFLSSYFDGRVSRQQLKGMELKRLRDLLYEIEDEFSELSPTLDLMTPKA